jgi:hypothetical protein
MEETSFSDKGTDQPESENQTLVAHAALEEQVLRTSWLEHKDGLELIGEGE